MMLNLPNKLDQFLCWWAEGLALAFPRAWRTDGRRVRRYLLIRREDNAYVFDYRRDNTTVDTLRLEDGGEAGPRTEIVRGWLKNIPRVKGMPVVFRLPDGRALIKRVRYPDAARSELASIIPLDIERQTPFRVGSALFGYEVIPDHSGSDSVEVDLIIVPKRDFAVHNDALELLGVRPAILDLEGRTFLNSGLNLLPTARSRSPRNAELRTRFVLFALWIGLLCFIPYRQLTQTRDNIFALESELRSMETDAVELERFRRSSAQLTQNIEFYRQLEREHVPAIELLREVSSLLTDTTWLQRFQLDEGRLTLQGESDRASELPGLLEASEYFSAPEFSSPITRSNASGRDRFTLKMRVGAAR